MKKIEIEIPDGKVAKWVRGRLVIRNKTLLEEVEHIKTLDDAIQALGEDHQRVKAYREWMRIMPVECKDIIAYLKLRIICAALNKGWSANFNDDGERHFYPVFRRLDKWLKLTEGYNGYSYVFGGYMLGHQRKQGYLSSRNIICKHLALKNKCIAKYCGEQFMGIWIDFLFG